MKSPSEAAEAAATAPDGAQVELEPDVDTVPLKRTSPFYPDYPPIARFTYPLSTKPLSTNTASSPPPMTSSQTLQLQAQLNSELQLQQALREEYEKSMRRAGRVHAKLHELNTLNGAKGEGPGWDDGVLRWFAEKRGRVEEEWRREREEEEWRRELGGKRKGG
jgi:hypothetical protein